MKKIAFLSILLLLATLVNVLQAQDGSLDDDNDQELFDLALSRENGFLSPPPATFSPKEFSTFNPQLPKVNVITGEYCEEECDLIIAGIEPLSYRRFYGHHGHKDECYGHWRINPECLFLFNFETREYPKYGAVGSENGGFSLYENGHGNVYTFDAQKNRSITNGEAITGQNHPLNTRISYRRVEKKKEDNHFYWEGVIEDGNGRKRFFQSDWKMWPKGNNKYTATAGRDFVPPYQAKIIEERRPNGNIICYGYENYNGANSELQPHYAPDYYVLTSISAYSAQGIPLGSLQIGYEKTSKKHGKRVRAINVAGSDGRRARLYHKIREVQAEKTIRKWGEIKTRPAIYDTVLNYVETSWKPTQCYQYRWEHAKTYFKAPFLFQASQDDGRVFETSYDLGSKKVVAQSAPVGPNDQMAPIARYEYQNDHTVVYDGENNKTVYKFNGDKRITSIEKYQDHKLYSIDKSEYDPNTGNVLKKTIEDGSGNILSLIEYVYEQKSECR